MPNDTPTQFKTYEGEPDMAADIMMLGSPARIDQEVVEMALLLPRWQADALEDAARSRGMTTGQMLRRVIADLFSSSPSDGKR